MNKKEKIAEAFAKKLGSSCAMQKRRTKNVNRNIKSAQKSHHGMYALPFPCPIPHILLSLSFYSLPSYTGQQRIGNLNFPQHIYVCMMFSSLSILSAEAICLFSFDTKNMLD
jgi:hypothetical protein